MSLALVLRRAWTRGRWCFWRSRRACAGLAAGWFWVVQVSAQTAAVAPLHPVAVSFDGVGNAYFADVGRHEVFEATLGGVLTVVAGSGVQGFAGDGGAATSAELNAPQGVAIGPGGELYIADTGNQRIRVVSGGTIRTFAGSGVGGFSGDGGAAGAASFLGPTALAVDASGALLVCDTLNHRLRRVSGGVVSTMAGSGVQGFAGDGGAAAGAAMDSPQGVAVASDGRIFVADSRNHRVRVIEVDGTISTLAGTGAAGYGGDGGPAVAAKLNLPRGLAAGAGGGLLLADSDNRRIRQIDAQGVITTVVGAGVQGVSLDATQGVGAWLNAPRGVGLSSFGEVTMADKANQTVQAQAPSAAVYTVAALVPARGSQVALSGPGSAVYGQWAGQVRVSGSAATPMGQVQVVEQAVPLSSLPLTNAAASVMLAGLGAGAHVLTALYAGDLINPAASSGVLRVSITPAPVVATANSASMLYGAAVPPLSGSLTGVLVQDVGSVTGVFASAATPASAVGVYAIEATLAGAAAGDYTVSLSASSGSLTIAQAPSHTVEPAQTSGAYAGVALPLRAVVSSTTSGVPTGTVTFSENGVPVGQAGIAGGLATAPFVSSVAGAHSIVASYAGDADFLSSVSTPQTFVIAVLPDFSVSPSGASSVTAAPGTTAIYTLALAATSGSFDSAVSLSVSGLPAGATASFSPSSVVPGSAGAMVVLTIVTPVHAELRPPGLPAGWRGGRVLWAMGWLPVLLLRRGKKRLLPGLGVAVLGVGLLPLMGCGARSVAAVNPQTYTVVVTGAATNLAGVAVAHSTNLTLVVE